MMTESHPESQRPQKKEPMHSTSALSAPLREPLLASQMAEFYRDVDAAVAAHQPTCWNRGACCKFGKFGHRLYVTDLELAYFVDGRREEWREVTTDGCPYQLDGMCTAREHRPLGCRIFFCDESAKHWQGPEYERFLGRLKQLGEELGIAYRYREWLSALGECETAGPANSRSHNVVDGLKLPVIQ